MPRVLTPGPMRGQDFTSVADFPVAAGERVPFVLSWHASYEPPPVPPDTEQVLTETEAWWREWSRRCTHRGAYRDAVVRSLITLKALTYAPTGGIVAAPTTSLPEKIGGVRNWDYRICWLRDATFTLLALLGAGYVDEGIWDVRGPRQHFTHSKVMAWVALDRAARAVQEFGLEGPFERWRRLRDTIHSEVCRRGFDGRRRTFVQAYGSKHLDASLLMIPLVGFLPASDPRVVGTVTAIERHLLHDGFVRRYNTDATVDGLPPGEGGFLPCTFWLADNLALQGRRDEARELFGRLPHVCHA